MTNIDKRIWLPHHNAKFLDWFDGIFDSVFIALHPFSKVGGLNPEAVSYRTKVFDGRLTSPARARRMVDEQALHYQLDHNGFMAEQKERGTKVAWAKIIEECDLESFEQLNSILLTTIQAAREPLGAPETATKMEAYCKREMIFLPTEGCIHVLLEKALAEVLKDLEYQEVTVGDEYYLENRTLSTEALNADKPWRLDVLANFRPLTIYSSAHTFLISASFDEFYTAICGNRKQLTAIGVEEIFEGFWCGPNTRPFGWN